jgi:hypothetical protein
VRFATALWIGVTTYFVSIAVIYGLVGGSAAGVVVLVASAAFGGLVAGWSWRWISANPATASDHDDGDAGDEQGPTGIYPAASLRPLGLAVGMTTMVLGVPLGSWMLAAGAAMLASQVGLLVRDRDG